MKKSFFAFLLLLVLLEISSLILLKKNNENAPFFLNFKNTSNTVSKLKKFNYNQLNALTGWEFNENTLKENGYDTFMNQIILKTNCDNNIIPKKIFITGGSTSDLMYDNKNWPIFLLKILDEKDICADILVGAVGGYNSGQEFLRLMETLSVYSPNIVISYSGANEHSRPNYVSKYEQDIFNSLLYKKNLLLPNTIYFLRKNILKKEEIKLNQKVYLNPSDFWIKNMNDIKAISNYYDFTFFGILQPVLNYSGFDYSFESNTSKDFDIFLMGYDLFYPSLIKNLKQYPFLHNFTQIFQNIHENPFIDDCHLKDTSYQKMVADSIFTLIEPLLVNTQDSISMQD